MFERDYVLGGAGERDGGLTSPWDALDMLATLRIMSVRV